MADATGVTSRPLDRLPAFALVGLAGFAIDGGVLSMLVQSTNLNVYAARGCSFALAVTVTWLLNRRLVFRAAIARSAGRRSEYGRYFAVQVVGASVNLGVFWLVLTKFPALRSVPIVALAVGALCGLLVNYAGSRYWVFQRHTSGRRH